jgi:hypothetical protein
MALLLQVCKSLLFLLQDYLTVQDFARCRRVSKSFPLNEKHYYYQFCKDNRQAIADIGKSIDYFYKCSLQYFNAVNKSIRFNGITPKQLLADIEEQKAKYESKKRQYLAQTGLVTFLMDNFYKEQMAIQYLKQRHSINVRDLPTIPNGEVVRSAPSLRYNSYGTRDLTVQLYLYTLTEAILPSQFLDVSDRNPHMDGWFNLTDSECKDGTILSQLQDETFCETIDFMKLTKKGILRKEKASTKLYIALKMTHSRPLSSFCSSKNFCTIHEIVKGNVFIQLRPN